MLQITPMIISVTLLSLLRLSLIHCCHPFLHLTPVTFGVTISITLAVFLAITSVVTLAVTLLSTTLMSLHVMIHRVD